MTRARVQPDPGLALLELYDTALPEIYGYLLVRCGRHGLAEDLGRDIPRRGTGLSP